MCWKSPLLKTELKIYFQHGFVSWVAFLAAEEMIN